MSKKRPPDFGDRAQRLRKAYERLGTDTPQCLICGETNPLRLELHHPAQHKFDDCTVIVCSNHHDDASDWQKDHPAKIEGCTGVLEQIGHWLLGLGDLIHIAAQEPGLGPLKDLLIYVAHKLRAFGRHLIETAGSETATAEVLL